MSSPRALGSTNDAKSMQIVVGSSCNRGRTDCKGSQASEQVSSTERRWRNRNSNNASLFQAAGNLPDNSIARYTLPSKKPFSDLKQETTHMTGIILATG